MSFSHNVKEELLQTAAALYSPTSSPQYFIEEDEASPMTEEERNCCRHAETYGMFLLCRDFGLSKMGIKTETKPLAERYATEAKRMTGHRVKVLSSSGKHKVNLENRTDRETILDCFGHTGTEISRRFNRANLEYDSCYPAFLRGAFLSCGTVTNPEKDYHLEFVVSTKVLCNDLIQFLRELNFTPKYVQRNGSHIVYFKDSESVEDLLTYMGAPNSSLELMGTKMYKSVRNKVNRKMNFENANASRSFNAAYKQIEAIRYIEEQKGLGYLEDDLRELAVLRMNNEDYSLQELADHLAVPLSKSGVNHRLKKILETAENLKLEEQRKTEKKAVPN